MNRNINRYLESWAQQDQRKPLVIRGARQVGKTFAVLRFAHNKFENVIYVNLDRARDRELFREVRSAEVFLRDLSIAFQSQISTGKTLLFIDEIQNTPSAMAQLRFLYEESPQLHVVAAGSLLEVKLGQKQFSIPVGRVQYCYLFPVTFDEFVQAIPYPQSSEAIEEATETLQLSAVAHKTLNQQFREYLLIGGMPEVVEHYRNHRDAVALGEIYESLFTGFRDDIYKYAGQSRAVVLEFALENAPKYIGTNIRYEKFAQGSYRSREISAAFQLLEKAQLVSLVRPTSVISPPVTVRTRAMPKLIFLDVGIVNYVAQVASVFTSDCDVHALFHGQIAKQIVGQSLAALSLRNRTPLAFWNRNKAGSSAEIDFVLPFHGYLIPIEVKSGAAGRLRSLHQFVDRCTHSLAVRVYSGPIRLEHHTTVQGTPFTLLSVPFYLVHKIPELLSTVAEREPVFK